MKHKDVFAVSTHLLSSLGMDVAAHWEAVLKKETGIRNHCIQEFGNTPFFGGMLDEAQWQIIREATQNDTGLLAFEQMAYYSAMTALEGCKSEIDFSKTAFILSTTKGNIEWLNQLPDDRISLHKSASVIASKLGISTKPFVISQACISGVAALIYGKRLLASGRFENIIITGADRFTNFVMKGFQSFQAIASGVCKPFDAARSGINLGEAAATIILSTNAHGTNAPNLLSGATSNDANHISGPSRTGAELALAITNSLDEAGISAKDIDAISAHGTATLYNDEMEAKAFHLAGVAHAPVHSLKGNIGHTLGAAGIAESILLLEVMRHEILIPSAGFENTGVSMPLNILKKPIASPIQYALKTASGFGGCNGAVIWKR